MAPKQNQPGRKPLKAIEICQRYKPSPEASQLLRAELTPKEFMVNLREKGLYKDAIYFLAHALSKREAVWWGLLCVWQVTRPAPDPDVDAALKATVQWVQDPTEANRRAAREKGELVDKEPAGRLAFAAFWSGGSMTAADLPPVEPPENLTSQTVAAAVLVAANRGKAAGRAERYQQFLRWGISVVTGANHWEGK